METVNLENITSYAVYGAKNSSFAFQKCSNLNIEIVFPEGMKDIPFCILDGCSKVSKVTLPEGLESISYGAFEDCSSLAEINIPSTVTSISDYAFYGTAISSVELPAGLKSLSTGAFGNCKNIKSVDLTNITNLGIASLAQAGLTSVTVPGTTTFDDQAFHYCTDLKDVKIEEGDHDLVLPTRLFGYCNNLESLYIPGNAVELGELTLAGCAKLADIYCSAENAPTVVADTFGLITDTGSNDYVGNEVPVAERILHIPNGATASYTAEFQADGETENYWKTILIDKLGYTIVEDAE